MTVIKESVYISVWERKDTSLCRNQQTCCLHKTIYSSRCFILQYIHINISKASRLLSHTRLQLIYLELLVSTKLSNTIYKFFCFPNPCSTTEPNLLRGSFRHTGVPSEAVLSLNPWVWGGGRLVSSLHGVQPFHSNSLHCASCPEAKLKAACDTWKLKLPLTSMRWQERWNTNLLGNTAWGGQGRDKSTHCSLVTKLLT